MHKDTPKTNENPRNPKPAKQFLDVLYAPFK